MESDSKISIDAILDGSSNPVWAISTKVFNISLLAKSFSSCLFLWIDRSGNAAAHVTAKYALDCLGSLSFVPGNLPASLAAVRKMPLPVSSFSSNILKFTKKKKKRKKKKEKKKQQPMKKTERKRQ